MMENPSREEPITAAQLRKAIFIARYFVDQAKAMAGAGGGLGEDAQAVLKASLKLGSPFSLTALWDKLRHRAQFEGNRPGVEAALAQDSSVPFLEHIQGVKDSGNSLAVNIALTRLMYDCNLSKFRQVDEQVSTGMPSACKRWPSWKAVTR